VPEVRPERTNWRDQRISQRHRRWGWDCPAVDLDFLLLEYDRGRAAALVEYKHEKAPPQYATHPTYRAMIDLGNRAGIPVFGVRYAEDWSWWRATPLNDLAREHLPQQTTLTEEQWISLLYRIRGIEVPQDLFAQKDVQL
jgi:hypothetical protein